MSDLQMDPERMQNHATDHEGVGTDLTTALDDLPGAVDGGIAADLVVAIMERAALGAGTVADLSTVIGGVVRQAATDSTRTDQNVERAFTDMSSGAGEDG